jgi:hypothetical protein
LHLLTLSVQESPLPVVLNSCKSIHPSRHASDEDHAEDVVGAATGHSTHTHTHCAESPLTILHAHIFLFQNFGGSPPSSLLSASWARCTCVLIERTRLPTSLPHARTPYAFSPSRYTPLLAYTGLPPLCTFDTLPSPYLAFGCTCCCCSVLCMKHNQPQPRYYQWSSWGDIGPLRS